MKRIFSEGVGWTWFKYRFFRMGLGIYLSLHFFDLIRYGKEIFSNQGNLSDRTLSPILYTIPNIFSVFDTPNFVLSVITFAFLASIAFAAGILDRWLAIIIWYITACLLGRNPLISNFSMPIIGWLLIAHAMIPGRKNFHWRMPKQIYLAAWVVMACTYTYSGFIKLASPTWSDGTVLFHVLENPIARAGFIREYLLTLSPNTLRYGTWACLGLEVLFAPLALFRWFRPFLWLGMVCVHVSLLILVSMADVSIAMLCFHWFTFNPSWTSK